MRFIHFDEQIGGTCAKYLKHSYFWPVLQKPKGIEKHNKKLQNRPTKMTCSESGVKSSYRAMLFYRNVTYSKYKTQLSRGYALPL